MEGQGQEAAGGRGSKKFCSPLAANPFCSARCHLAVSGLPPRALLSVTAEGFLLNVFVCFPIFLRVVPHQKQTLPSAAFVPSSRASQPDHVSPTQKRPPIAVNNPLHGILKTAWGPRLPGGRSGRGNGLRVGEIAF